MTDGCYSGLAKSCRQGTDGKPLRQSLGPGTVSRDGRRATARLSHANIAAIYDLGRLAPDGAYLMMALLRGRTWRAELNRGTGITAINC